MPHAQAMNALVGFRQDEEPAAEQQHFNMTRLNARIAFDNRVDRVEAFAEVTGNQDFTASDAHKKRCRSVFQAERVVQSGHRRFPCLNYVGQ